MNSFSYQGQTYKVEAPKLTVAQIRALAIVPQANVIIVEGYGGEEDRVLSDNEVLDLTGSLVSLYSKPPTSFGAFDAHTAH